MAVSSIRQPYIEFRETLTVDSTGRAFTGYAYDRFLFVTVLSSSYICIPRYHSDGTMLYVYDPNTMQRPTSEPTLNFYYVLKN